MKCLQVHLHIHSQHNQVLLCLEGSRVKQTINNYVKFLIKIKKKCIIDKSFIIDFEILIDFTNNKNIQV